MSDTKNGNQISATDGQSTLTSQLHLSSGHNYKEKCIFDVTFPYSHNHS